MSRSVTARQALWAAAAFGVALWLVLATTAAAQNLSDLDDLSLSGQEATEEELLAWAEAQMEQHIRARSRAERILAKDPASFVAHLTLGWVHHYGEANLPRALFHLEQARRLFEGRFGPTPGTDQPWRWHAQLLREMAAVHGDMEHHTEKLAFISRYNERYDPHMIAERAWPLMKLGHFEEARLAANLGLAAADRPGQRRVALNALCAIEFEAGNDGQSYEACRRALDDAAGSGRPVSTVDLTNFAEAARSLFKLDEAERVSLEATTASLSWYGNPWLELAELYTRQGRFVEALSALRKIGPYRSKRPPHVRDADRNETRRGIASFLLAAAHAREAYEMTTRALEAPDRRAHNSRDPAQDRAILALLDRRARLTAAEQRLERAAAEPWYTRPLAWLEALGLRLSAGRSGALAARLLGDDQRLSGVFRIGTAHSAVMPPWLAGELVEVIGPGVAAEALRRARKADDRAGADAYYDAFEAEAALHRGEHERARLQATSALSGLGVSEALLAARAHAVAAEASTRLGRDAEARRHYDAAFQRDPGVFRRLGLSIAVRIVSAGGPVAEEVAAILARSPRFDATDAGLTLRVDADRTRGRVCLTGDRGQLVACAEAEARTVDGADAFARRLADQAHRELFAPRIDLSQADINSLDGGNLVGRGGVESLFE